MATSRRSLSGGCFAALVIAGLVIGGRPPDPDASAPSVAEYWSDRAGSAAVAGVLEGLGAAALLYFCGCVVRALGRRADSDLLAITAVGGGVVAASGFAVDAAIRYSLANRASDIEHGATVALNSLYAEFFAPMLIGLGVLVLAAGGASRRLVLPGWLTWSSLPIGAVALLAPAAGEAIRVVGLFAPVLWIALAGVVLSRDQEPDAPAGVARASGTGR